jgi:hypothetical protein
VVVAAVGNESLNLGKDHFAGCNPSCDVFPFTPYPAAYPGVIGVSATDVNDIFAGGLNWNHDFSSDGIDFVDMAAPGMSVLTTNNSDGKNGYTPIDIRKARYNGSNWDTNPEGTVVASGGFYPSVSVKNPPGGTAYAVWMSGSNAPYAINFGP